MTSARTSAGPGPSAPLKRYLMTNALRAVTATVGGLVIPGLTAVSAGVYDAVAEKDGIAGLDQPALDQVIAWRTPFADRIFTVFTHLGGPLYMTLIAGAVTLLMLWRWRSLTPLILMIIAVAGSLTFTKVGKAIVGRLRLPLSAACRRTSTPFLSFRSHAEQHRHCRHGGLSRCAPAQQPPRHRPVRRLGHRLGSGNGFQPDLPRPPLAHRRHLRLDSRPGLARPVDHGAPHSPRRPPADSSPRAPLAPSRPAKQLTWVVS
jgi:hypothetical protein